MAGANLNWCVCTHTSNMQQSWIYPWFDLDKWHEQPFHVDGWLFRYKHVVGWLLRYPLVLLSPSFTSVYAHNHHSNWALLPTLTIFSATVRMYLFVTSDPLQQTSERKILKILGSPAVGPNPAKSESWATWSPLFQISIVQFPMIWLVKSPFFMVESVESSESAVQMGLLEGLGRFQRAWPAASQKMDV